jgi:peptidoglycan/xylan/chitin deacetylase (PgdA/CDA1 family)
MGARLKRLFQALLLAVVLLAATPQTGVAAPSTSSETTVTLTFTGGYNGQDDAAKILAEYGLAGTFYINSGHIGDPAYLTVDQLRAIARARSEVGGASLMNHDLSQLSDEAVKQEICDDRATLYALGFPATSFSFPYGSASFTAQTAAESCGYNSARGLAGLLGFTSGCGACPLTETVPPRNAYEIRTVSPGLSISRLKAEVRTAEQHGGGWLVLPIRYVCVCPDKGGDAFTPTELEQLVAWLADRPATTQVRTVDQVVGGELQAPVGTPLERLVPHPSSGSSTSVSRIPAWSVLGMQIGQAQLLFTAMLLSVAVVATYRAATRSNRYGK